MPDQLSGLSWDDATRGASLGKVQQFVFEQARAAISWYRHKKNAKKRSAVGFRIFAIVLGALGGILPILPEAVPALKGRLSPAWATIVLAAAGTCVVLDKFLGHSAAWIRYVVTELKIDRRMDRFQLDWERTRLGIRGPTLTAEETAVFIEMAKTFLEDVNALVEEETNVWANEFSNILQELESRSAPK